MSEYTYEGSDLLRLGEQLPNYNASIARVVARVVPPGSAVLDFGAGFGTLTREVARLVGKPDCVEPDAVQRDALVRQGFRCFDDISAVSDGSYDYVYSSNVLEHIDDDVDALRSLRRVLRPDGKIVLYLPAFQRLYTVIDAAIGHRRRYDARMIADRLRAAGFRVDATRYADLLGFGVSLVFKAFANRVGTVNERTVKLYDTAVFPVSRAIESVVKPPFGKNVVAVATRT